MRASCTEFLALAGRFALFASPHKNVTNSVRAARAGGTRATRLFHPRKTPRDVAEFVSLVMRSYGAISNGSTRLCATQCSGSLVLVKLGGALAALAEQREGERTSQAHRQPRELGRAHARVEERHAEQDGHGLVAVAGDGHLG